MQLNSYKKEREMTVTAMEKYDSEAVSQRSGRSKTICRTHLGETEWAVFDSFRVERKGVEAELEIRICAACHKEKSEPSKYLFALTFYRHDEDVGGTRIFYTIADGRRWLATKDLDFHFFKIAEWRDQELQNDQTLTRILLELADEVESSYAQNPS